MATKRTVFITGASSGFGRDTAMQAAERGHAVFATMRGVDGKNADVAADMRERAETNGWDLHVLELDVTDQASIDAAVQAAIDAHGRIDVVINNAGYGTLGPAEGFTIDQVKHVFDVNVFGVVRVNQAVLPHLREQGAGHIIYLSSGLGRFVFPFVTPYASTKFAVEGLAEGWAYELRGEGIDTTIVEPGAFGTSFGENMAPAENAEVIEDYGPGKEAFEGLVRGFQTRESQDPQRVVDAMLELIESEPGDRPLRRPVGDDATMAATPINEAQAASQSAIMAHFGFE